MTIPTPGRRWFSGAIAGAARWLALERAVQIAPTLLVGFWVARRPAHARRNDRSDERRHLYGGDARVIPQLRYAQYRAPGNAFAYAIERESTRIQPPAASVTRSPKRCRNDSSLKWRS